MNRFSLLSAIAPALLFLLSPTAKAWEPAAVDEDFAIQGEYFGRASTLDNYYMGVQVVAWGKNSFAAVVYQGGLPGAGWDRYNKWNMQGERIEPDRIEFSGAPLRLVLKAPTPGKRQWFAAIGRAGATRLAVLPKIHRISATQDHAPPPGAKVLFNGAEPEHLQDAKVTEDGLLDVGFLTAEPVGDFRLHLEFRTPYMPDKRGQGRGNSGVYIQRRYELQILDSFGLEGVENECGGLYRQRRPDVNMCLPPLSWQTYDIYFTAARFDEEGNKTAPARITALHNGVKIHDDVEIKNKTGAGRKEGPEPLPILFQNHRDPVRFRNMWIIESAVPPPSGDV